MEVISENISYEKLLLEQLNSQDTINIHNNNLKLNIYLTLLSLSNNSYKESIYEKEHIFIEKFLRKTNNIKVKIQLKRKEEEINKLIDEILELYKNNSNIISKYNKDNLDIENIISSKNAQDITSLIDKLTKEKMSKDDNKEEYDNLRIKISSCILESNYYIEDNILFIEKKDKEEQIQISLDKFYDIFEYLLNIDTYEQILSNTKTNRLRTILITNMIKFVISNEENNKNLIVPIILTYLLSKEISDYIDIDTSSFNIENIKITELYSLASLENQTNNNKTAKWKKIMIPNEYLLTKINEIVKKGMYYFEDDKFILENIENNISDFKLSIEINKIIELLKEIITILNLKNKSKKLSK